MPRGGHNRRPDRVKELEGTARADRKTKGAPKLEASKVPEPPKGFSAADKALWRELAGQVDALGTYAVSDYSGFRLMVRTLALAEKEDQFMPPTARVRLLQAATSLLCGFGLTPASRSKVGTLRGSEMDEVERDLFGPGVKPRVIEGGRK